CAELNVDEFADRGGPQREARRQPRALDRVVGDHKGGHQSFIAVGLMTFLFAVLVRSMASGDGHCGHSSLGSLSVTGPDAAAPNSLFFSWLTIRRQYVGLTAPYG